MLARIPSEALSGLESHPIDVEADVVAGAPAFTVVGLPDAAVQESRERVRSAIVNSGFEFPSRRITVNLAPADVRKEGPSFDLPIALAFLMATAQARCRHQGMAVVGELALDGGVRPVTGVLALAQSARRRGVRHLVVPSANAREAALVDGLRVLPAATLREAVSTIAAEAPEPVASTEAAELLQKVGYNELPSSKPRSILAIALEVAKEPMFLLLVAGGLIYLMLGDLQEALMLLGFVFVVMGITLYQERKTERALEALRDDRPFQPSGSSDPGRRA